jgi:hypothetical protein
MPRSGRRASSDPWLQRASLLATLATATILAGGAALHALGAIFHRTYLANMGVSPALFPKSVEWSILEGFYVFFDRWYLLFNWMAAHPGQFIVTIGVPVVAGTLYWKALQVPSRKRVELSPFMRFVASLVANAILACASLALAVVVVFILIFVIGAPAEYAAKDRVRTDLARFTAGCSQAVPCTMLRKGENTYQGIVVDISEARVALYEPASKQVRILEIAGGEITSPLPPAAK